MFIEEYMLNQLLESEPPRTCRCSAPLRRKPELKSGLCPICAEIERKQRRIEKARRTAENLAERKRLLRESREAEKAEVAKIHGEWAARSEHHLVTALAARRKRLLKILTFRAYNLRIEESRNQKAAKAAEVSLRRAIKNEWYNSNPPRTCRVCGEDKHLYDFPKNRRGNHSGYTCKKCDNRRKKERERKNNPPKPKIILTDEQRKERAKAYRQSEAGRAAKLRAKTKNRSDPIKRINRNFSNVIRDHLRKIRAGKPIGGWKAAVGYSLVELVAHLESKFRPGMSWENYGEWSIDHIIPKAAFKFTSVDDPKFKECWALDNLQPLWAEENSKKRDIHPGNMLDSEIFSSTFA